MIARPAQRLLGSWRDGGDFFRPTTLSLKGEWPLSLDWGS